MTTYSHSAKNNNNLSSYDNGINDIISLLPLHQQPNRPRNNSVIDHNNATTSQRNYHFERTAMNEDSMWPYMKTLNHSDNDSTLDRSDVSTPIEYFNNDFNNISAFDTQDVPSPKDICNNHQSAISNFPSQDVYVNISSPSLQQHKRLMCDEKKFAPVELSMPHHSNDKPYFSKFLSALAKRYGNSTEPVNTTKHHDDLQNNNCNDGEPIFDDIGDKQESLVSLNMHEHISKSEVHNISNVENVKFTNLEQLSSDNTENENEMSRQENNGSATSKESMGEQHHCKSTEEEKLEQKGNTENDTNNTNANLFTYKFWIDETTKNCKPFFDLTDRDVPVQDRPGSDRGAEPS